MKPIIFIIGKSPRTKGNDIRIKLEDPFKELDGNHCKITFLNGYFYIEDLNSKMGTYVNDLKIDKKTKINSDSNIRLGFNNQFYLNHKTITTIINMRTKKSAYGLKDNWKQYLLGLLFFMLFLVFKDNLGEIFIIYIIVIPILILFAFLIGKSNLNK